MRTSKHRPKLLSDWIDRLGKGEARPKLREPYACDRGRNMLRELRETSQKATA
jgi:hypothetical protein